MLGVGETWHLWRHARRGSARRGSVPTSDGPRPINGQRTTDNKQRATDNGQQATDNGQRTTDNGQRTMDNDAYLSAAPIATVRPVSLVPT